MKCSDFKFDLPLFADNILSDEDHRNIEEHLVRCPLCRQELAGYHELRESLRSAPRPPIPQSLLETVRTSVREALSLPGSTPAFLLIDPKRRWIDVWLVPSAVAGLATLVAGFMLLTAMMTTNAGYFASNS